MLIVYVQQLCLIVDELLVLNVYIFLYFVALNAHQITLIQLKNLTICKKSWTWSVILHYVFSGIFKRFCNVFFRLGQVKARVQKCPAGLDYWCDDQIFEQQFRAFILNIYFFRHCYIIFSLNNCLFQCQKYPIDFKLGKVNPDTVGYNAASAANLKFWMKICTSTLTCRFLIFLHTFLTQNNCLLTRKFKTMIRRKII